MTMRAGLGHPNDAPALPPGVDDVAKRMMALSVSLVGRAGENAAVYAVHAGRHDVLPQDVHRALQYQAKTFLTTVTDDEVADALEDVTRACDDASDSDEATASEETESEMSELSEEDDLEADGDEDEATWTRSACDCEICVGMNEAHETWETYAPEDEALKYLKDITDKFLDTQQ